MVEKKLLFFKKMNILLTGGAGYTGSHTIIELDKAGHSGKLSISPTPPPDCQQSPRSYKK